MVDSILMLSHNFHVYFTADGKVYKAYVEGSGSSAQTRLVEAIDLSTSTDCAEGNYDDCVCINTIGLVWCPYGDIV